MPNHFHFLVQVKELLAQQFRQIDIKEWVARTGAIKIQTERHPLASSIGILLSSYSQAVNKQNRTTGSLFQHKTKAKHLDHLDIALQVFNYIHQNPLVGGLVSRMEDWPFSSFSDYAGLRAGTLCNQELAFELFPFTKKNFYSQSYRLLEEKEIRDIF